MGTRIPLSTFDTRKRDLEKKLQMSTAEIGLSVRTTNCLEDKGIFTVHDLLNCTRDDLLSIANFGEKTLGEVYIALEAVGFAREKETSKKVPAQEVTVREMAVQEVTADSHGLNPG